MLQCHCNDCKVLAHLLPVTFLLVFAQFVIFCVDLLFPPGDEIRGYQQRTVGLGDALAVEILLPVGPAFMFNRC